ncbi:NUDIX hydrolase [Dictyobacter aurantiacus]|uniref:NUDIX hydrolase n=1 Tax=Dictyobacter aurantiacus TaxID=1936993 RepID=A0A401ZAW2_9CHLR|nr:NUDIX domain-containing protein [Dictyobacter aurantiacus]GCE03953.1 NUDIX hydrolase [Dictyobacter aurantiacus]
MEEQSEAMGSGINGRESRREEKPEQHAGVQVSEQVGNGEAHQYDVNKYERPSVTVDVLMMSLRQRDLQILLIKRRAWPYEGMWAIPGGFINMNESLESAAKRELQEETGVQDVYLEQLYTFGDPGRDPRTRVITVVYFALLDSERLQVRAASDAADVGWFSVYELPQLAFDHQEIVDYALNRLRNKLEYTTIAFNLLPEQFTLRELQRVYEIILHRRLDKRNFRKKILSTNILEDTGAKKMEGTHRPARLYRFNPAAEHKL